MEQPAPLNKPLVFSLALLKFIIPFILIAPEFELQRDEYLYFAQGAHPALGYLENPPLLSWLGMISRWMGGAEWTIRIWPALIGSMTLILTCMITARLGGKSFAQLLAGTGIITGAFLRIHILFQPNILDIFFWILSFYFLIRFLQTQDIKNILWLVISLALGWWSKYSVLFIAASIFLGLAFTRYRWVFIKKQSYLYFLLGFLIVFPNIFWQYFHNWPLLHHMRELRETQLVHVSSGDFIKEQLLILFPVLFVWLPGLIWTMLKPSMRSIGYAYLLVITFLILGSGKSYYAVGVYPVLLAAGGVAWEKWTRSLKWMRYAIIILIIVLTVPFIPIGTPVFNPQKLAAFYKEYDIGKTGLLKWEDQRDHELPQDFADMLGWRELTQKAEKLFNSLPDSARQSTIVYGRHYGHAGAMIFYGSSKKFRDKVTTDNGSFLLWINEDKPFRHLIFLGRRMPDEDDAVFQHFERVTITDSVTNKFSRQFGDKIIFFENGTDSAWQLARQGLKEMKSRFKR